MIDARIHGFTLVTNNASYRVQKIITYESGCTYAMYVSTLIICIRVNIPTSEYNISDNDLILMIGETLSLPDAYIITTDYISLCLDDYTAKADRMKRLHSEHISTLQRITVILSFVCSLISMACLCITIFTYVVCRNAHYSWQNKCFTMRNPPCGTTVPTIYNRSDSRQGYLLCVWGHNPLYMGS